MQKLAVALLFANGLSYKHKRLAGSWIQLRLLQHRICHMWHFDMLIP
jgi:hypothetical protein